MWPPAAMVLTSRSATWAQCHSKFRYSGFWHSDLRLCIPHKLWCTATSLQNVEMPKTSVGLYHSSLLRKQRLCEASHGYRMCCGAIQMLQQTMISCLVWCTDFRVWEHPIQNRRYIQDRACYNTEYSLSVPFCVILYMAVCFVCSCLIL